ncbi:SsrA-binding protein SmpB [Candidatus Xiphinematobacter sp. Idaho Grape]|uniref:SsrA-binding protein SmpB n=1 Tax=Candidatus Xiphinematobacter sp. Idaho Grape TaxID=1704307 RepID=UPI000AE45B3E|nr:SsrA-binding protein SmpB [Candidatus Xiphinematobacter sp. Idaho Grape]
MKLHIKDIVTNRRALQNYAVLDKVEAGIALVGTEVKSIRENLINPQAAYAKVEGGEVFLYDLFIQPYERAGSKQHEAKRRRKLLLHRGEINKLLGKVSRRGYSLVPLRFYWRNARIKVELAIGRGQASYDKREVLKKRATQREAALEVASVYRR